MSSLRRALSAARLLPVVLLALPAAGETFRETLMRWDGLSVEPSSRAVSDLVIGSGRLTLRLASGRVAAVRAGDEVVGLFLSGKGTIEHLSSDAVEHPVVKYVARKNTGLDVKETPEGLVLSGRFEEALWLASGAPLPAIPDGPNAGPVSEAFAKHRDRFGNLAARPLAHGFVRARRDAPSLPYVRVEAGGGRDELVHVVDGVQKRSESLYVADRVPPLAAGGDDRKYLTLLSELPIGRDRRVPVPAPFFLTDVDLVLTASSGEDAKLSVTETFQPVGSRPGVLLLELYDTIRRWNKFDRIDLKRVKLTAVLDEVGNPLEFDHRNDTLAVALRAPLSPDHATKVRFEIEGELLHRPSGDSYWELGTEPWFPQPDMGGQYFTVHSTVKVKKPFAPLVPGKTVRRVEEGDYNVLETRIGKPVQFFVVLAGKYKWNEETADGLTIRVASYGGQNRFAQRNLQKLARKMIDYYTGFLGPFPFEEFNIVEINDYGYGQAPPAYMFITTEAFNPIQGEVNQYFSQGINERFAHEIAHQWWGHVVKMPSGDEQWISESFAEYCAALLIRDLRGKSDYKGLLAHWRRRGKESRDVAPIPFANRVYARNDVGLSSSHRTALLYSKGPILLEALHRELGDRPFLVFLASVQSNLAWKFGSTHTFTQVLNAVGRKDFGPFLERYYWGLDLPEAN